MPKYRTSIKGKLGKSKCRPGFRCWEWDCQHCKGKLDNRAYHAQLKKEKKHRRERARFAKTVAAVVAFGVFIVLIQIYP